MQLRSVSIKELLPRRGTFLGNVTKDIGNTLAGWETIFRKGIFGIFQKILEHTQTARQLLDTRHRAHTNR